MQFAAHQKKAATSVAVHPTNANLVLSADAAGTFFFFITQEPRVIQQSMSLRYEPSSEPLPISAKQLFLN